MVVNSQNISDLKSSAKATDKDGAETVGTSKSSPIDVKTLPDKDDDQPRKSLKHYVFHVLLLSRMQVNT